MRCDGLVVFVPFVAPGETVKAKISRQHKNFAEANVLQIIDPSPQRRQPLCPYFGRCGGCQLQHMAYEQQVAQKAHFVEDALSRIGKLKLPEPVSIVPSKIEWAYRRHIRLTLFTEGETYCVGYVGIDDVALIAVQQCPIFALDGIVQAVGELVGKLAYVGNIRGHLSVIKDGADQYVLYFDLPDAVPANLDQLLQEAIQSSGPIVGAMWKAGDRGETFGKTDCHFAISDLNIAYSPMVFVQSHPEQSEHIYHQIEALTQSCGAKSVLDLYCGIGVTSLLLEKQGATVVGIESNPQAIVLAKQNARNNDCKNVTFECADVAKVIRQIVKQKFDLVILNPPRIGSDAHTLEAIASAKPAHIVYVSCMPATLARDLSMLCGFGYNIEAVRAYDMFPQTTHVETVVLLRYVR